MATIRRGVKHTRRRRGHHAKTKKKISKRYRGRKGFSKRITRRHTRRSHDTDIINTQSGGNLTIWSAAKTAAGKALELKIISRYLLKNINKTINLYIQKLRVTPDYFYTRINDNDYRITLPLNVQNALKLQNEVTHMSNTAAHDLPDEILSTYSQLFPEDKDTDISLFTTDGEGEELEYDENEDEVVILDTDDKLNILTGIRHGDVSIKAKKINYHDDPTSASIDSGDACRFLGHIFHPSGVPFYMIVVFYAQSDYILPQLEEEYIKMLSYLGVTTTGEPRRGNLIFVRKIVKINMTHASGTLCGDKLTPDAKEKILSDLKIASGYVKSDIQSERAEGESICKKVDGILRGAGALLRVSVKNNSKHTENRIQARVLLDLRKLKESCEVDDNPALSPIGAMGSSPTILADKKAHGLSFSYMPIQSLRRDTETPFFRLFKPGSFEKKTNEEIGKIVMEALLKSSNPIQHLKRIYHAPQSQGASARGSARGASARSESARGASARNTQPTRPRSRSNTPQTAQTPSSIGRGRGSSRGRGQTQYSNNPYAQTFPPPTSRLRKTPKQDEVMND